MTINRDQQKDDTVSRVRYVVGVGHVYFVEDTSIHNGEYRQGFVMDSAMTRILSRALR